MPTFFVTPRKQALPGGVHAGHHWLYFTIFSLLLCVLTFMTLKDSYGDRLSNAKTQNTLTTSAGAEIINRLIENIDILFPGINEVIERVPATMADYDMQIRDVLLARKRENPQLMDLLVVDREGRITHWTGTGQPPAVTDRLYVKTHIDGKSDDFHFVGRPQLSKVHSDQWFFAVSHGVRNEGGELQRILVAIIDIDYLHSALVNIERAEEGTFVVGSRDGILYSRVPDHDRMVGRDVPILRSLADQTPESFSTVITSPLDRAERVVSVRQTREPDLLFISSLALETLLVPWHREVKATLLVLLLALMLVGGLTFRLHRDHRTLVQLSTYDGLSGLLNRSTFMRLAQRELMRGKRYPAPLSAILIDLDDFKQVNDLHGHLVGDNLIRSMGQLLTSATRDSDLCCRYGGEEFLLLLPHTGLAGAQELAEKLRQQINALKALPEDAQQRPSGSFGVAELQPDETLGSLFQRADQAMYRAKRSGKNRVESCQLTDPTFSEMKATGANQ